MVASDRLCSVASQYDYILQFLQTRDRNFLLESSQVECFQGCLWDYTNICAKQSFFHDENRANLFEVEPASRMLLNTDNGTPMPQVGGALRLPLKSLNKSCKVFQVLGVAGWGVGGIEAEAIMLGQTCMKWVAVFSSFSKGAKENAASASPKPAAAGNSNCNLSEISWRDAKYGPRIKELSFLSFFIF
ncbi:unnamed protein product [Camellia sinensis]